jgi:acyl-CoA synthetase (NDP forming)
MESEGSIERQRAETVAPDFDRLLCPRSIALIGASSTPGSLADCVVTNLEQNGYDGELYLVNPKRAVIHGRQCLGSIDELPDGVDCAVLAIPAIAILDAVRACAGKGVGSVIVPSAGFAESGAAGVEAQAEMARIAREHQMVLEGPNCLGMVNYLMGIPLTFVMTPPQVAQDAAGAAILSQSGALAAVVAVNMRHFHIPLTFSVSTGNEAANGVEDFLEHLIGNEQTKVFALVVEQFRQPRRFLEIVTRAREAGKHVVLLHPGRSNAARASAVTHTGAIAGDYEVMRMLVARAGVIVVDSIEELVDVTQILVRCRQLPVGGAAIFTESGAFKAIALDLCEQVRLPLPAFSLTAQDALRRALPSFIAPSNPLDLTAQGLFDPELYRRTLPPVLAEEAVGSVLLAIILTDEYTTKLKLPPIVDAVDALRTGKPVIFAAMDEGAPFDFAELDQLRRLGVPCFPSAERAMRALARISTGWQARRAAVAVSESSTNSTNFSGLELTGEAGALSEAESKRLLRALGVATPRGAIAASLEEALKIGAEIGFPVVMKAHCAALSHKTDAGGVLLNIKDEGALMSGWHRLHGNLRESRPELVLEGVLVEQMAEKGVEFIVGGRREPQWGPVLLVGLGGVMAELVGDVRLLAPDLSLDEIKDEVNRLRGSAILHGFRGGPALDIDSLARVLVLLGEWMVANPEIAEIDINPLVVYGQRKGVVALDAVICIGVKEGKEA